MNDIVDDSLLRLVLWDSPHEPKIIISGRHAESFRKLQLVFSNLSNNLISKSCIHEEKFLHVHGSLSLTLYNNKNHAGADTLHQGLRLASSQNRSVFEWRRSLIGWDYLAKLIQPFADKTIEGHQYLTRYPDEDAIVIVSSNEYSDDILFMN